MGSGILHPELVSAPASSDGRPCTATIGRTVRIVGQIYCKEDLYVSGDLRGTVEVVDHTFTIGPNATVHAGVRARAVVVLGMIEADVEATERIEIRKEGRLIGDIRTPRIIVEDGAYLKGCVDVS